MFVLPLGISKMVMVHFCTQTPCFFWILRALLFKFKGGHVLYVFGAARSKGYNGDVHFVFCATQNWTWWKNYEPFKFLCPVALSSFQLQCMLILFICSFKLPSMSSWILASLNQPLSYCHVQDMKSYSSIEPSRCQIHRHFSASGIDDMFSRCILLLLTCFVDHAMPCSHVTYTKIKAKTKATKCK